MTRFVVDASALLSGVISVSPSPPALILEAMWTEVFEPVICPQLIAEVRRGLRRPYFAAQIEEAEADGIITAFERAALVLPNPRDPARLLRDSKDDYLVALARAAEAGAIVTGDRDLLDHLDLEPPALTPRAACVQLGLLPTG